MSQPIIKVPFAWREPRPRVLVPNRLIFHPLTDDRENDFLTALRLSLSHSRDRSDRSLLAERGVDELVRQSRVISDSFEYQKSWWHLAYTGDGDLVGFLQPVIFRGCQRDGKEEGAIYNYGVVPDQRGNGYSHDLLLKLTAILQDVGIWRIFADVDEENVPSLRALSAVGYEIATDDPEFHNQGPWRSTIRSVADIPR